MTQDHPITPSPELLADWLQQACRHNPHDHSPGMIGGFMAYRAARWGADQELEACLNWIAAYQGLEHPELLITLLRAAMRPKPPSLKEQALAVLDDCANCLDGAHENIIRRALEHLDG